MSLNEIVLLFDKQEISEEQIVTHVQHYVNLANRGLSLVDKDRKAAMECLKEIRATMSEEYKYYTRSKVQTLMWRDNLYNTYNAFITEAFVKQNSPNAYKTLSSNLYDVAYYGRHYYRKFLTEESD